LFLYPPPPPLYFPDYVTKDIHAPETTLLLSNEPEPGNNSSRNADNNITANEEGAKIMYVDIVIESGPTPRFESPSSPPPLPRYYIIISLITLSSTESPSLYLNTLIPKKELIPTANLMTTPPGNRLSLTKKNNKQFSSSSLFLPRYSRPAGKEVHETEENEDNEEEREEILGSRDEESEQMRRKKQIRKKKF
jgi:hypothetical protein